MRKKKIRSVAINNEMWEALRCLAKERDTGMSSLIREGIKQVLKKGTQKTYDPRTDSLN